MRRLLVLIIRVLHTIFVRGWRYVKWRQIAEYEAGTVAVDGGAKLYYRHYRMEDNPSDKHTLLLLHGGLTSMWIWFPVLPLLHRHFHILCIDFRGQGRSSLGDKAFTYRLFAQDVDNVLSHLNIHKVAVAGWSDGGNVGLTMALDNATHLSKLVTFGANFHHHGLIDSAQNLDPSEKPPVLMNGLKWLYYLQSVQPNKWLELWRHVATLWQNFPTLTEQDLHTIDVPMLVVIAQYDMVTLDHSETLADSVNNGQLKIIDGVGHNVLVEAPEQVETILLDFLVPNTPKNDGFGDLTNRPDERP